MDYGLQGKTAIVTGGTSGIGLEIARIFTEGGARVAITGRDEEKMGRAVTELEGNPGEITGIRMDLERRDDMDRLLKETESRFGPLDILVNNAGRSYPGKFFETGPELWETILRNRIVNPLYLTQKALAGMGERGRGSVTFMSAVISKEPIAENVMAGASQGVLGAVKALARLMAPQGVRVNTVLLGQFDTPLVRRGLETYAEMAGVSIEEAAQMRASQNPMGRFGEASEAAHLAAFLSSDAASYMTGALVPVDGGRMWGS